MRLTFNPLSRKQAVLLSCLAFVLSATAGIEVRGAIVLEKTANATRAATRSPASSFTVEWSSEYFLVAADLLDEDGLSPMPYVVADDGEVADAATSTEEAQMSDQTPEATPADEAVAEDQEPAEDESNELAQDGDSMSGDQSASNEEAATGDESVASDENAKADQSAELNESASNDETGAADEPAAADEMPSSHEGQVATDDKPREATDGEADTKLGPPARIEEYYKYRSESPDEQYGENSQAAEEAPSSDEAGSDADAKVAKLDAKSGADDEEQATDEPSSEDTASDDSTNPELTNALIAIVGRWTNELRASYGVNLSSFSRLWRGNW